MLLRPLAPEGERVPFKPYAFTQFTPLASDKLVLLGPSGEVVKRGPGRPRKDLPPGHRLVPESQLHQEQQLLRQRLRQQQQQADLPASQSLPPPAGQRQVGQPHHAHHQAPPPHTSLAVP